MKTLHETLKNRPKPPDREARNSDDLRGRYNKIGISAVAAAAQFTHADEKRAPKSSLDPSSAHRSSRHR
jgi:hypothetical protein